ncbi:hypothetical protein OIB37_06245 [Streptomyces sp. NBC_00820]|uniref:hypothetical protein n=1 Tax=Streptomyces sp. NBC_00820 TaxID=2975842 RepID=UPI002ED08360|nr:hypothetical protein OIB37_06245 [Streptomyces sp. NBC_00820]
MLRILDARTGEPVAAVPARRGLTRVEAYACGLDLTSLRVLLTADLLVRALEIGGTPVWTILTAPREHAELRAAATALGIRPFEESRDLGSGLGEDQVVHVVREGERTAAGGAVVTVAPVVAGPGDAEAGDAGATDAGRAAEEAARGAVLRLALLSRPRNTPVRLDAATLDEAAHTLARDRSAVARWAREPSRPVPEGVRTRLRAAWEDDLDLPAVLAVLRDVAHDPDLTDGARFETYVYADRLLGLELARDLGSPA